MEFLPNKSEFIGDYLSFGKRKGERREGRERGREREGEEGGREKHRRTQSAKQVRGMKR